MEFLLNVFGVLFFWVPSTGKFWMPQVGWRVVRRFTGLPSALIAWMASLQQSLDVAAKTFKQSRNFTNLVSIPARGFYGLEAVIRPVFFLARKRNHLKFEFPQFGNLL